MRPGSDDSVHLTYCTNVHAGESLAEVRDALRGFLPGIKASLSPDAPFGVGLRLSATASRELEAPGEADALTHWLKSEGLYVFTINGFPYGPFHGEPVKEAVYRPDWMEGERRAYTDSLAKHLAVLLDGAPDRYGSISTVPGAFRPRVAGDAEVEAIADALVDQAVSLVQIGRARHAELALALEPEPCCFLETTEEAVAFLEQRLYVPERIARFANAVGNDDAEALLRRTIGICLDTCHAAVEFEDAEECVRRLDAAGIHVAKIQLSSGLRIKTMTDTAAERLRAFDDGVYLHQVVARSPDGKLTRFLDLDEALTARAEEPSLASAEWRVHFHIPIFTESPDEISGTRGFLSDILALQAEKRISRHLEVETYTWGVLPEDMRGASLADDITSELRFALEGLRR